MTKVFIDGRQGTTGLRIYERINRPDLEMIVLSEDERKDDAKRKIALNSADIAFLCLPDVASIQAVGMIENPNVVVIDTSTAHRTNPDWAYGFPELGLEQKIASSKRIAVPGCHASGFIALVKPLIDSGILPQDALLSCFSLTGYSGGGKKMIAEYQANEVSPLYGAPRQYALGQTHKHLAEMVALTGLKHAPVFSPVVANFYSGMEVTVPLHKSQLTKGYTFENVKDVLKSTYSTTFVQFVDELDEGGFASANALSGLDTMQISMHGTDERVVLVARYDNLGKGASGAAIECMNIVLGLDKTTGLVIKK